MNILAWAVFGLLAIAAATSIGRRLGIAAPLLLTVLGIAMSLLPFMSAVAVEPEWILAGVLPPLLYSAAVSMPTMEFRRDFTAISGLSVVLVVISSVVLGLLFAWLIPGLGTAGGIALGAIISPTDAVVISIMKRLGVSSRTVAVLEGESLLNDASALVLLRSALAGMSAAVSLWTVFGNFLYAVAVAVGIGWVVGELNLRVRASVEDSTVNTAISFTIPFLAAIPAEQLGASGLVAAVVAGLVTGRSAPRFLSPRHRLSDSQNWRTVELVLEGAVFLIMGLELQSVIQDVYTAHLGVGRAFGIAALALLVTMLIRAAYVAPLLAWLKAQSRRSAALKPTIASMQKRFDGTPLDTATQAEEIQRSRQQSPQQIERLRSRQQASPQQIERWRTRLRRMVADIDYLLAEPLGWREGAIVVWAGLRGVVTLAAAQTLPETMPSRSLLVFVAFLLAVGSLLLQGGTLPWLIRLLKPAKIDQQEAEAERVQLTNLLDQAALKALEESDRKETAQLVRERLAQKDDDFESARNDLQRIRLQMLEAQRQVLLDARDNGEFSAALLSAALENLDADQISLELKGNPVED